MLRRRPMKTATTIQSQPFRTCKPPNLFQQTLSPKALTVAVVVATIWLFFFGFQIVRSVVGMNPSPQVVGIAVP